MKDLITIKDKTYKKCKVVILPSNVKIESDKTFLWKDSISNQLFYKPIRFELNKSPRIQHLYIISDEEIKEGDYYYDKEDKIIFKCLDKQEAKARNDAREIYEINRWFKIIATTDTSLNISFQDLPKNATSTKLPRPSDDFLKKYCEVNGKISDILVEYEEAGYWRNLHRKEINAPKPEFVYTHDELKIAKDNTISIKPVKDSWNREEVIKILHKCHSSIYQNNAQENVPQEFTDDINKWIEQNL